MLPVDSGGNWRLPPPSPVLETSVPLAFQKLLQGHSLEIGMWCSHIWIGHVTKPR